MFAPRWFQGFQNEYWRFVCMISRKTISGLCSSFAPPKSPQRSPGVVEGGCWSEAADTGGWEDVGVEGYSVFSQACEEGRQQALAGSFLDLLCLTLLWNSHVLGFCSRATQGSPLEHNRPSWECSQLGEESGSEPRVTRWPRAPAPLSCSHRPLDGESINLEPHAPPVGTEGNHGGPPNPALEGFGLLQCNVN